MLNKLVFLFLLATTSLFAQFDVISLKLVNSDNTPNTGEASNITFRRSPFTEGNVISGLTVTEVGVTGNYTVEGFSTFERVKYYLSGVEQTWWGGANGKYVGNITSYITSLLTGYVTISTGQTISGIKNFSNLTTFANKVQQTANENFEMYRPQLHASSPWISWLELPSNALPSVLWGDSSWGRKHWYYDGTNMRMESGAKWLGRTNTTPPFPLNTSHFEWNDDKLNLNSSVLNADSIRHKLLTLFKDTTWSNLGEPISKNKLITFTKDYWATSPLSNVPDWYMRYESRDVDNSVLATSKYQLINDIFQVDNASSITLTNTDTKLDSIQLLPGTYSIDFGVNYTFIAGSFGEIPTSSDSIIIGLNKGSGVGNIIKNNIIATRHYQADANQPEMGTLTWKAALTLTSSSWIYIVGKRQNVLSDLGHIIYRQHIVATRIN